MALFGKDIEAFAALYAADVRIFDAAAPSSCEGLEQWRKSAEAWFDSFPTERVLVSAEGMRIFAASALGGADGLMIYKEMSRDGVPLGCSKRRFTWTVQKRLGLWKVVHEHTSFAA